MHAELRAAIHSAKIEDKYTIAPISIEDEAGLASYGINPSSVDTIVCIQCLCSCPNPKTLVRNIHKWLKPGGKLIIYEHVASPDSITSKLQYLWTELGWRRLFLGCEMTRPSGEWLEALGGWKEVKYGPLKGETRGMLYPHAAGLFVKQ